MADFIYGQLSNGIKITLYKATRLWVKSYHTIESDWTAKYVFYGKHINSLDDIKIFDSAIRFSYIDEWTCISGFQHTLPSKNIFAAVKYKQPKPIELYVNDYFKIQLWFSVTSNPDKYESIISQKVYVNIIYNKTNPGTFKHFIETTYQLRNFLGFAISRRSSIQNISIDCLDDKEYEMDIYFSNPIVQNNESFIPDYTMLLPLSFIRRRTQKLFSAWFENCNNLNQVFNLYFNTYYTIDLNKENKFLNIMMALETYHRKTNMSKPLSNKKYKQLKKQIIGSVSNSDKPFVKEKIKFLNEPTLKERMEKLVKYFDVIVSNMLKPSDEFCKKIVKTRNYIVHSSEKFQKDLIQEYEYDEYINKLMTLLQVCILKELGLKKKETISRLRQSIRSYKYFP